ncbi:GIY-YIG nuclease family protein [Corynebacterium glucuronolyticum]
MASPKTAKLFLMDGSPKGRIKCSFGNWVGKVYLIPRTEITRSRGRSELAQTGIYLLFGTEAETGEQQVYVGQARERKNGNGVLGRVIEHLAEEKFGYFTHAVMIIDSDNNFGPTEISYLENAFYLLALKAGRFRVINSNVPSPGNVTEEMQADLEQFISYSKTLIGTLGYRVFDPVDEAKNDTETNLEVPSPNAEPLLYLDSVGASGTGRQTTDGFVVLAGAKLRATVTPSVPKAALKNRKLFADRINSNLELTRDTLFSSPSAASDFLIGASTSGQQKWKNSDGVSLRDLERDEARAATEG